MLITGKSLPRRTMLKGLGVTLALPLLDAMSPAAIAKGQSGAASKKVRLVAIEMVHVVGTHRHQCSKSRVH